MLLKGKGKIEITRFIHVKSDKRFDGLVMVANGKNSRITVATVSHPVHAASRQ